jgi:hypothetical protein
MLPIDFPVVQYAFVVDDIDAGIMRCVGTFGAGETAAQHCHVAYLDARATMGCFIEVLEKNAIIDHVFAAVKAMHEGWDGPEPIRFAA